MTTRRLPLPLESDELRRLRDASADRPDVWAAMTFLRETGLRISEACSIPREAAEGWKVARRFRKEPPNFLVVLGKGSKERLVYLSPEAVHAGKMLAAQTKHASMWPWTDRGTRYLFAELGKKAGVAHVYPHRFRHTFAFTMVEAGNAIEVVADIMGHTTIDITRLYYATSRPRQVRAFALRNRAQARQTHWRPLWYAALRG